MTALVDTRPGNTHKCPRCALAFLLLLLSSSSNAGDFDPGTARFRRLDLEQGLSQGSVLALALDRHGFLWLGTQDGLNRYDGFAFRTYRPEPGEVGSLSDNWISALAVDTAGNLWAGTNGGLNRFDAKRDRFEVFRYASGDPGSLGSDSVFALHVANDRTLWIGHDAGLSRFLPQTRTFESFPPRVPAHSTNPPAVSELRVRALAPASDGKLWVGTIKGLLRFDPQTGHFEADSAAQDAAVGTATITTLLHDSAGRLWVGTDGGGLVVGDAKTDQWVHLQHAGNVDSSLSHDRVLAAFEDDQRRIWIGTEAGLDLIAEPQLVPIRFAHFRHQRHDLQSLGRGRVVSVLQSPTGTLFFGTWNGGLSRLSPLNNRFASFNPDTPTAAALRNGTIPSLASARGRFWLGSRDGLYTFDPATHSVREVAGTAGLYIDDILISDAELWLATRSGVRVLDLDTDEISARKLPSAMASATVRRFIRDGPRIWVAASPAGLYVLDVAFNEITAFHPLGGLVSFISVFDDQRVVVGAQDGLSWFSRDGAALLHKHSVLPERTDGSLPASPVGLHRDRMGRVWVASYGRGLLRMELGVAEDATTARFVDYSRGAGLPSDALDSLLEDERGRLWISSDRGISRLDPATGQFRNFDATDGALPRGYMIHAAARLESGQFAFGGSDGFTVFDPETIVDAPPPPRPLLTQLTLGNRPVGLRPLDATSPLDVPLHLTSRLRLPWAQARSVGLGFSVPEFAQAERLSFLYQLEGFDPDWITTDSGQRSIAYTNLEPGGYRFRLRVVDPDGTSSSEEAGLAITVVAPWWITAWAQAAYALSIALLVLGAHKLRLRRVKGQRRTLQLEVGLRTAELKATNGVLSETLEELTRTQKTLVEQEKMASLGQLVAGVAHEINTPLGVAVTASSMLRGRTDELCAQFEQGGLRGSDLTDYLHLARQATAMVDSNLARAAHLVHSFKQVSVDRASDDRRRFDLGSYLQALVSSLEPACNPRAIRLVLTCADGIGVESYPGTLGQIITNFVQNALLHAYAEAQPGTLSLNVHRMGEREIVMVFADDGRGISASALPHVFEPFYTTRRGQGGTGLGLHVVYNLVSVRLGGQIEVSSELGRGTMFTVRFPQLAPKT